MRLLRQGGKMTLLVSLLLDLLLILIAIVVVKIILIAVFFYGDIQASRKRDPAGNGFFGDIIFIPRLARGGCASAGAFFI